MRMLEHNSKRHRRILSIRVHMLVHNSKRLRRILSIKVCACYYITRNDLEEYLVLKSARVST